MAFSLSPETKTSLSGAVGFVIAALLIVCLALGINVLNTWVNETRSSPFLDHMPDTPRSCLSDYRYGGTSKEQLAMENRLYADLREGSKYALPETVTTDAYDVIATEAEPTSCMLRRAAVARETPMPEGQYTPYDEIENGFLERKKKAPLLAESALTSK